MPRRYSDIMRAPLLQEAYQKKKTYEDRPLTERFGGVGDGTPKSPVVWVAVKPFGEDLPSGVAGYIVRSNQRNRNQLSASIGTHAVAPPGATAVREGGFQPSLLKVSLITGSGIPTTSKITGIKYLKYNAQNFQHPFGQAATTDREYETFGTIAAAIATATPTARVSYKPEKFRAV